MSSVASVSIRRSYCNYIKMELSNLGRHNAEDERDRLLAKLFDLDELYSP